MLFRSGIFRDEQRPEYCETYRATVLEPAATRARGKPPKPADALAAVSHDPEGGSR